MEILRKIALWILAGCFMMIHLCDSGSVVLKSPQFGTAELRSIDSYVSSGLPLFQSTNGFLLHSGNGPVIVKNKDPNKRIVGGIEQPNVNYYANLPSVIPEGFEGVSSSLFQLGRPSFAQQQPATATKTTSTQFPVSTSSSYSTYQSPFSFSSPQALQSIQQQQYATSPLTYNSAAQQPQAQAQQQFQTFQPPPTPTSFRSASLSPAFQPPQQTQSFFGSSSFQPFQQQQQQVNRFQQQQPRFLSQPSINPNPIDNSLQQQQGNDNNYDRRIVPTNFISGTGIRSTAELVRNPVVEQTIGYEEELPQNLRNPFYSNSITADYLARESLPAQGETVVHEWTTDKIRDGKIRELLSQSGFLT